MSTPKEVRTLENVTYYIRAFLVYLDVASAFCSSKNIHEASSRCWNLLKSDRFSSCELTSEEMDAIRSGKHSLWGIIDPEDSYESGVQLASADYGIHKSLEEFSANEVAKAGRAIFSSWDDARWAEIRTLLCNGYRDPEAEARRNFYKTMLSKYQAIDALAPDELECRFSFIDEPY